MQIQRQLLQGEFRHKGIKDTKKALDKIEIALDFSLSKEHGLDKSTIAGFLYLASLHVDLDYEQIILAIADMQTSVVIPVLYARHPLLALEFELYLILAFPEGAHDYFKLYRSRYRGNADFLAVLPFRLFYFYQVVRCSRLMARGQYFEARAGLVQLHQDATKTLKHQRADFFVALFYLLRFHIVMGISAQSQGDYEQARVSLRSQNKLLSMHGHQGLLIGYDRRCLSLLIEQELYSEALKMSHLLNIETVRERTSHAMLIIVLQEQIKLSLYVGHLDEAQKLTHRLRDEIAMEAPGEEVVLPIEAQCEIALLRSRDADEALMAIKPMLGHVKVLGYYNAEVVASIYLIRAFLLKKDWMSAEIASVQALHVGAVFGYGRDYLRLLILSYISLAQLGRRAEANKVMLEAHTLARKLDLKSSELIIHLLRFTFSKDLGVFPKQERSFERRQVEAAAFFCRSIFYSSETGLKSIHSQFNNAKKTSSVRRDVNKLKFRDLGSLFIKNPEGRVTNVKIDSVYLDLLQNGTPIYSFSGGSMACLKRNYLRSSFLGFSAVENEILKSFHAARGKGLTLEQIYNLVYPEVSFHPLRHGPRIYSLISKMNLAFEKSSVSLSIKKKKVSDQSGYYLFGDVILASVSGLDLKIKTRILSLKEHPSGGQSGRRGSSKERYSVILEHLRQAKSKGGMSGAEIARKFGLSRQALHRDLKDLCKEGKIEVLGKGRYSKFALAEDE